MNVRIVGILAAGALLTFAAPAAAQDRARVSGSESSYATGPTCVVDGVVSDCGVSSVAGGGALGAGSIIVGVSHIVGVSPIVGPVIGPIFGGPDGGRAGSDTDVDRSTRNGNAVAR